MTVVVVLAELLVVTGSGVTEVTLTVFVTEPPPGVLTATTIVIVTSPPLTSDGISTRTVPLVPIAGLVQVPAVVAQLWNVVCGGSGSLTWTVLAVLGPKLWRRIV